ncbi:uncharacterized protein VICG_00324 [Vittaforma corneae ATCC 50505]|uniref:Peptidase S8/S53 domain-containing protein n=1 Tax=Vittaforma corneae (strain ATCC 50505) TaxID=993615 RepID=L2GQG7_VITCO|nr:uncharacterized protein VICG_00324 [Vittaforma corneae ATCC 50505]ELA42572.1 hypothetical protein VICG_00324 [Vittaforma corneae ATCC 50505]
MLYNLVLLLACVSAKKKYNVIVESTQIQMADVDSGVLAVLDKEDLVLTTTKFGYTLELSDKTAKKLKNHPKVKYFEEDKEVRIASFLVNDVATPYHSNSYVTTFVFQKNSPWGLSRISGHVDTYEYIKGGGKDVIVYVLDTGVDESHPEFGGRAKLKYNVVNGSPNTDEQGHGTHCAGVIGSKTFGVAKDVNIVGVKVLDRHGAGSISRLVEGIDFVVDDYLDEVSMFLNGESKYSKKPSGVVSMSIGGEKSEILNYLIRSVSEKYGVHFSTAAGNEHKDACKYSPSSSSTSLTVGASDVMNQVAKFSNNGECVDLYAPGVDIESTWPGNQTRIASGTSMATPHVAGIMAVYLGLVDFTPEDLKKRIWLDSESVIVSEQFWSIFSGRQRLASLTQLYDRLKTHKTG